MVMFAVPWQIYSITKSAFDLGMIGLVTFAPAIGFALYTGYVADRFDRRHVIAICSAVLGVSCLLLGIVSYLGMEGRIFWVFVLLGLMGTGRAFYQPAVNSFVANLVPAEELPNAIAWHTSANKITQTTGPALGGLVYIAGPEWVYGIAVVGLLFGTISFMMIRTRNPRKEAEKPNLTNLLAGLRYVVKKKIVLGAISLDLFVVLLGGVTALFPIFAQDILGVGAGEAGFFRSSIALGSLVTGLGLTMVNMRRNVGRILFCSIFVFGAATILFSVSEIFWLSLAALAIVGAADMVSVNIRVSLIQIATPDEMRGRVNAVNSIFTGGSNEIGEFRAGTMAGLIGAVPAALVGGVGAILVGIIFWRMFPSLVNVQRLDRGLD